MAFVVMAAGAAAAALLWFLHLHGRTSSSRPPIATPQLQTLQLHLRGFGTPLPAQIDRGPCAQGRTLIEIQPSGSVVGCVLRIRKWNAGDGRVEKITQTVRETYHLTGGTVITREIQTIRFARDQRHTTAAFRGHVIGGTGRYASAHGAVAGGGPGVGGRGDWNVTLDLRYR